MKKYNVIIALSLSLISQCFAAPTGGGGGGTPTPSSLLTSSPIPIGPQMTIWALKRVDHGELTISSPGFEMGQFVYDIEIGEPPVLVGQPKKPISSTQEMLDAFSLSGMSLPYKNPTAETRVIAQVLDAKGTPLFLAENSFLLDRKVSLDGKKISYERPEWSGNLWFYLADLTVPFTGSQASVHLSNGDIFNLDVNGGNVTIPGWFSRERGMLEVWYGNLVYRYDMATGLPSPETSVVLDIQPLGLDGLEYAQEEGMVISLPHCYPSQWSNPFFESTPAQKGWLTIDANAPWYGRPIGMWYYSTLSAEKKYMTPNTNGTFNVPAEEGQSLYFQFEWNPSGGKG